MELAIHQCRGIVREYDKIRGCGIIESENCEQVFVRYSAITGEGVRMLRSGDRVSFYMEHTQRGFNAVHVKRD